MTRAVASAMIPSGSHPQPQAEPKTAWDTSPVVSDSSNPFALPLGDASSSSQALSPRSPQSLQPSPPPPQAASASTNRDKRSMSMALSPNRSFSTNQIPLLSPPAADFNRTRAKSFTSPVHASAAAAGTARAQADSVVSLMPQEIAQFKATYLGMAPVSSAIGESVVAQAVEIIRRTPKPRNVKIVLTSDSLQLIVRKNNVALVMVNICQMSFTCVDAKRKRLFSFIVVGADGTNFCHTLQFKNAQQCAMVNKALAILFVASSNAARRSGTGDAREDMVVQRNLAGAAGKRQPGTPLGLFPAEYLGSVPVVDSKSQEVCDIAAEGLLVRNKRAGGRV